MRVVVTGHRGYIGTVMVPLLLAKGHEVTGYDIDIYSRCDFVSGGSIVDVPAIRKDVRDAAPDDFKGVDLVVEAVYENPELKAKITKLAEAQIGPDAVMGSNTSTLPITDYHRIAIKIILHFFQAHISPRG